VKHRIHRWVHAAEQLEQLAVPLTQSPDLDGSASPSSRAHDSAAAFE
jgi:hypothetical protein